MQVASTEWASVCVMKNWWSSKHICRSTAINFCRVTCHASTWYIIIPVNLLLFAPSAAATSFFHGRSGDSQTVRSLSLLTVPGIAYLRNWNSCGRQQQHPSVILRHFCSTQHTSPTNYGMRHRADCRRRTTNAAVIIFSSSELSSVWWPALAIISWSRST